VVTGSQLSSGAANNRKSSRKKCKRKNSQDDLLDDPDFIIDNAVVVPVTVNETFDLDSFIDAGDFKSEDDENNDDEGCETKPRKRVGGNVFFTFDSRQFHEFFTSCFSFAILSYNNPH
jgi:hypothetical protein